MTAEVISVIVVIAGLAFGFGIWFHRIDTRMSGMDQRIAPLIALHKDQLVKYYLEKGVLPNPSLTPRRQYLIDRLKDGTISHAESQELADDLRHDEKKAREQGNTEAVIAILGLLALVLVLAAYSQNN
jgi:hypothetical protein